MIVQCPQCRSRYRLEEKQFAGRPEIRLRCTKCNAIYAAKAPAPAPKPTPAGASRASSRPSSPASRPGSPPIPEATIVSRKGGALRLPADKRVALSATQGPLKGRVFPIGKPRVVLGRQSTDIVVDDPEVSRKHCALEVRGNTALLVDLGSTNGTFVEGERVDTRELEHLSEFRIGATTLMLTISSIE